jgi:hypothetical protein
MSGLKVAQLSQACEIVPFRPSLNDLAVPNTIDCDVFRIHGLAGRCDQLIDDWADAVVSSQVTKLVHLQNPRTPGPSGDIALQERCKILRARWKLLAAITDLIEVQIHDGVNQAAHHHPSVSACG